MYIPMNETTKVKEPMTMIRVHQETREKLEYVRKMGETYDEIISRLFYAYLADDQGNKNTSAYEKQRLLRWVKSETDEQLQEVIADADAHIEKYKERGAGRYYDSIQAWANDPLDALLWCLEETSLSLPEMAALGVLIHKKIAEIELRRRSSEPQ